MSQQPLSPVRRGTTRMWISGLLGAVLGWLLTFCGLTASVTSELDERSGLRFRVRVLGVLVHRYPEDGDVFGMRPYPEMLSWESHLAFGFMLVGAVVGGGVGGVLDWRAARRSSPPIVAGARTNGGDL